MANDLIERLNETARLHTERAKSGGAYDGFELRAFADEAKEAADALSSKDAALSEMRAELERWAEQANKEDECRQIWQAQALAAESQLEMARKALGKIVGMDSYIDATPRGGRKVIRGPLAEIAARALAEETK